jgi:hypothetical protein
MFVAGCCDVFHNQKLKGVSFGDGMGLGSGRGAGLLLFSSEAKGSTIKHFKLSIEA